MATVLIRLADIGAVRPSDQPVVGGGEGRVIRLRHFSGALLGPALPITLGEDALRSLRRFQLIGLATAVLGTAALVISAWQLTAAIHVLMTSPPISGRLPVSAVALSLLLGAGTAAGAAFLKRWRPPFFPVRVSNRAEVRLENLDPQGVEEWMARNEGLVRLE